MRWFPVALLSLSVACGPTGGSGDDTDTVDTPVDTTDTPDTVDTDDTTDTPVDTTDTTDTTDTPVDTTDTTPVDLDNDGSPAGVDCDDNDPARSPAFAEVPFDDLDNDCDAGTIDDPIIDLDNDGSVQGDDCDDNDPARSPAFAEVLYDGIDNDCDAGTIDDPPVDLDGDGSLSGVDCDDNDPNRSPAFAEVLFDDLDNDCDVATIDTLPPTANFWTFDTPWETTERDQAEIARVFVQRRSWAVVYADDHGNRGAELFHTRVSQLSPSRILLENPGDWAAHQLLHLAVYEDQGVANQFDAADPLLADEDGWPMETALDLHFISSTTVEDSAYYAETCTNTQFQENRTDLPVDCRCNEALFTICMAPSDAYNLGDGWASGPRLADVNNVGREVGGGFVDEIRREYIVAMNWKDPFYTESVGTIWAIDVDSGDRRVVSGTINTRTGYQTTGGGYDSNVTIGGVVRHTAPLPFLWDVQLGPDGMWYTYASDTLDNVEIVRVDPATGDRELVWHKDVAGQGHTMGQCTSDRGGQLSVQFTRRSFTMDPDGAFYLSFHNPADGDGIVRIAPDGSTCDVISRIHSTTRPDIGGGYLFQSQDIRGIGWANDVIYAYTVLGDRLIEIDPVTGDRTLVSSVADHVGGGADAIGENWMIWDDETGLLWTAGSTGDLFIAVDVTTGERQNLLRLSSLDTLVPGGHPVEHETRGPMHPGVWSRERFYWHPDNRDHIAVSVNGMGLVIHELHTSSDYSFSL